MPDIEEWDKKTLLGHEREMLGLYVSDHPLLGLEHVLANAADCTIGQLLHDEERADGTHRSPSAGWSPRCSARSPRRGDAWAIVTVEDLEGAIDVLFFPSDYQLASTLLVEDTVITVQGRLDRSKDQPELRGQEVSTPAMDDRGVGPVVISCPRPGARRRWSSSSRRCCAPTRASPRCGSSWSRAAPPGAAARRPAPRVTPTPALFGDLKHLLGPGCLG